MHFLISSFSFYNNRTTIAMFNGLVQTCKFLNTDGILTGAFVQSEIHGH